MTPGIDTISQAAPVAHLPRGPERFAALLDHELEGRDVKRAKLLTTVLSECGYRNRSDRRLRSIQDALVARGIYSRPRLTDSRLLSHERVEFSRMEYLSVDPGLIFPDERTLEHFVLHNYKQISELSVLKRPQRQYHLPSRRKIDLLFRECRTDDFVILELKVHDGGTEVVSQLFSYLNELQPIARAEGAGVRGVILTGEPNAFLEDQARQLSEATGIRVDWFCYVASLKLAPLVSTPAQATAEAVGSSSGTGQAGVPVGPIPLAAAATDRS